LTQVKFEWTTSGTVTIRKSDGTLICSSGSSSCSELKTLVPNGTVVYGKSSADEVSPSTTVTY
jgi:hypothetical protein